MQGLSLKAGDLPEDTLLEKKKQPSQQLTVASRSSARIGTSYSALLSVLTFVLAQTYAGLVYAVTTTMSSYVQPRYCVQRTPIPCHGLLLLTLALFRAPLTQVSPGRWEEGLWYNVFLQGSTSFSLLSSAPWPVLDFCVNHHLLQKEAPLMRVERYINLLL